MPTKRKILVTHALPYANGSLHFGHLIESIQTDIWVRFQKLCGHDVIFICGSDSHGTPIMIQANKLGISPEQLVAQFQKEHQTDWQGRHLASDVPLLPDEPGAIPASLSQAV